MTVIESIIREKYSGNCLAASALEEISFQVKRSSQITTSLDYPNVRHDLSVPNIASGFDQVALPLQVSQRAIIFLTIANPNSVYPEHSHHDSTVFRVVVAGSIIHQESELKVGDWMFVPAGVRYSISAGGSGATIIHIYEQPPD